MEKKLQKCLKQSTNIFWKSSKTPRFKTTSLSAPARPPEEPQSLRGLRLFCWPASQTPVRFPGAPFGFRYLSRPHLLSRAVLAGLLRCKQVINVILRKQRPKFLIFGVGKIACPNQLVVKRPICHIKQFGVPFYPNCAVLKSPFKFEHFYHLLPFHRLPLGVNSGCIICPYSQLVEHKFAIRGNFFLAF